MLKRIGQVSLGIKILMRIVFLIVALSMIGFFSFGFVKGCNKVELPPSITEAPWAIQTTSRVYYASEFSIQNGIPSIKNYWVFDGKHYDIVKGVKEFPKEIYGNVAIIRRTGK